MSAHPRDETWLQHRNPEIGTNDHKVGNWAVSPIGCITLYGRRLGVSSGYVVVKESALYLINERHAGTAPRDARIRHFVS